MTGWRDGATATLQAVPEATPFNSLTIPGDVQAGDVMLVTAACFSFTATSPGITLTSPAGTWTRLGALQDSGAESGLDVYSAVWTRVATGADASSALTFGFTGTAGTDEMWWAAAVGAWSGYAEASVSAAAAGLNSSAPACPSTVTATDGELAVYLAAAAIESAGSVGSTPGTQRENVQAAGVCAAIGDAGTPSGTGGASVGGGTFSVNNTSNWWTTFTVTLAPAITVTFSSTSGGVDSYRVSSVYNGAATPTVLRVLAPVSPDMAFSHSFCYALPVTVLGDSTFGSGLDTLQGLGANDAYNMTVVEPSYIGNPWYADSPLDSTLRHETFTAVLAGWVAANLGAGGEAHHLLGFSKSGIGGQDLVLKHPAVWDRCATWDFPADMAHYDTFSTNSSGAYGTDANFIANYELTSGFVTARAAPFSSARRIWLGGQNLYGSQVADYDALLTSLGVLHSYPPPVIRGHDWDSGWVPDAVAFLAGVTPAPVTSSGLLLGELP